MIPDNRYMEIVAIMMIMMVFRYRMTPPESPRDREGASVEMAGDNQDKHRDQGQHRPL